MNGIAAIRSVLVADSGMTAIVPAARIIAGPAKIGLELPFAMIERVSRNDRNIPTPGPTRAVRERVRVTVVAANLPSREEVLRAVRHAAADQLYPTVPGISGVTIHTDGGGPPFYDDDYAGHRESQDFMVKYTETR